MMDNPQGWGDPILTPTWTGAEGKVKVEAGALIQTNKPTSVVESGGFVMLFGSEVENAGKIVTERGQTVLAAGQDFFVQAGYGTEQNQRSTTRGNEVAVQVSEDSEAGLVINSGVIEAKQGDITLVGEHVVQDGVLVSTTSVHTRGTIHLLTNVADTKKDSTSVTLTKNSLTLILPELDSDETATDAQRNALLTPATGGLNLGLNNQKEGNFDYRQPDRLDQSRVEIMTAGTALFEGGSLTMAQGGQISVMARKRTFVADGAVLDVSGVQGVAMDMESNSLLVSLIQPYDFRDSGVNRDIEVLKSRDIWIDIRDLELLPSGTGGHDGDRYYTPGGLIEVSGHLGNVPHKIGEWTATAGSIAFASGTGWTNQGTTFTDVGELIVQKGAILDLSGGSLDYASGFLKSTMYLGSDGKLYSAGQAPANVKLVAIGANFMRRHERWGERYTEYFVTPFSRVTSSRYHEGYTVGRDAGTLSLSVPTMVMEGTVLAGVVTGEHQTVARPDVPVDVLESGNLPHKLWQRTDGYKLPQNVAPLAATLNVGNRLHVAPGANQGQERSFFHNVTISEGTDITAGLTADSVLPEGMAGEVGLSLDAINKAGFGEVRVSGMGVKLEGDLAVNNGGNVLLRGDKINVGGNISARSGTIMLQGLLSNCISGCEAFVTDVNVADGVKLDASGLWVNLATGGDRRDLAHLAGGNIYIDSAQGSLRLGGGSLIDVSAGGAITETNKVIGASGGNVVLATGSLPRSNMNDLVLGGEIRAYGSGDNSGGRLMLVSGSRVISIGEELLDGGDVLAAGEESPADLQVTEDLLLPAGSVLGFDLSVTLDFLNEGTTLGVSAMPRLNNTQFVTVLKDWIVPAGMTVRSTTTSTNTTYTAGRLVPAGTQLRSFGTGVSNGTLPVGFKVPEGVFQNFDGRPGISLATAITQTIPAGVLDSEVTIAAGFTIRKGQSLGVDARVAKPLHLQADFFQKGFGAYHVRAGGDMIVGGGKAIEVFAPTRRVTADSFAVQSGARPEDAMSLWTAPMFQEDAVNGRFVQRKGADLRLIASGLGDQSRPSPYPGQAVIRGALSIGQFELGADTLLRVDDGRSIHVTAADRMLIEGRIEARGGSVNLEAGPAENMNRLETTSTPILYDSTRAIWLESGSVIDVSGRAVQAVDNQGLRYAHVSAGGRIHVGGVRQQPRGLDEPRELTAAYVVVRENALLDASGASAEVDYLSSSLPRRSESQLIATDGGRIAFDSQYGIFLDGDIRATAGGEGAFGGELAVQLSTPILFDPAATGNPPRAVPEFMRRLRSMILEQEHQSLLSASLRYGDCIAGCWAPGQTMAEAEATNEGRPDVVGNARIGMDKLKAGGFESLNLRTDDVILFDGDTNINLRRNLTLFGTVANLDPDADVHLEAAYVNFAGGGLMWGNDITYQNKGLAGGGTLPEPGKGTIRIVGGLVDMAGIGFGASGSIGLWADGQLEYDYRSPGLIDIVSKSDIRLTGGTVYAQSSIDLTAAQIYPVTNARASILAGVYNYRMPNSTLLVSTIVPGSSINFHKLEGVTPAAPLSLYGTLWVGADIINQGGNLVAPLGQIIMGLGGNSYYPGLDQLPEGASWWPNGNNITSTQINLLPNSLTSVSAKGLNIPFGGTTDGLTWYRNGEEVATTGNQQGLVVIGDFKAEKGSVVDLSGGGTPTGAGFIPGRGGSVDILQTALGNVNPGYRSFSDPDSKVYAIVPAYQHSAAPAAIDGHSQPVFGQQIVIPEGVEGLKAGAYMLLPAEFATLEGAYRVEMGKISPPGVNNVTRLPDGSFALNAHTSIAHIEGQSASPYKVILTPSKSVDLHSQYDKMTFENFLISRPNTSVFGHPLPLLPGDGKEFLLAFAKPDPESGKTSFVFEGTGLFTAEKGRLGGSMAVVPGNYDNADSMELEILADGATATPGHVSLYASQLSAVGANMLTIGGRVMLSGGIVPSISIVPGGASVGAQPNVASLSFNSFKTLTVKEGARLSAAQIFLITEGTSSVTVESGATLSTLGRGSPTFDTNMGYNITNSRAAFMLLSNGLVELSAASSSSNSGQIRIDNGASLYSEGTLAFVTNGPVVLGEDVNYGARYLGFSTGYANVGSNESLTEAAAAGILPEGIALTQSVLDRLMKGDSSTGAPALERLTLSASQSVNFYGSVNLDAGSQSKLQFILNTPALYGHGSAGDVATVRSGTLVWNGMLTKSGTAFNAPLVVAPPGGVIANGPGTGSGTLNFVAERIVFGYQDGIALPSELELDRLALGFATVNFQASDRIEMNQRSSISIWQSQAAFGQPGTGGHVNLVTPLLTAAGGSNVRLKSGGEMRLVAPEGYQRPAQAAGAELGGEIHLAGQSLLVDTQVALPSGRLLLKAMDGDVTLGGNAWLDMAGRATDFFDETRYSWGGDVEIESVTGSIGTRSGALVDLSADHNHAGLLKLTALDGTVRLDGVSLKGKARNGGNAPSADHRNGSLDLRAGTLADFAAVNRLLNESDMTETRSILVKQGDLTIGDEVKARHVGIVADGGSLTVNGRIDASGAKPGSIRLSARDNLLVAGTAELDASGTALQVDGYGKPIEASNRAIIELTSADGTLTLQNGATLDLASPDGVKRGHIELNVARLGANDAAIDAGGQLTINGASSIAVNAFETYVPADGTITQAVLDDIHLESDAYINAAIANQALLARMDGLRGGANAGAFHFRPGVELASAASGSLRVSGDLNMAGYRYASLNPNIVRGAGYADHLSPQYGSGEAGVLLIRAADDLDIHGSITDGFGVPARTPDDNGWVLYPGAQGVNDGWIQDYKVPVATRLGAGARLPVGSNLGYDLPVNGFTVNSGTQIEAETRLSQAIVLPREWTATAAIQLPDGTTFASGSILPMGTQLPADTILGAGTVLPVNASLQAMTWPKGKTLPANLTLSAPTQLQAGDLIPRDSIIALDGLFGLMTQAVTLQSSYQLLGDPSLAGVTTFPGGVNSTAVLGFGIEVRQGTQVRRNMVLPFGFESNGAIGAIAVGWTTTAPIWASKMAFEANEAPRFAAGETVFVSLATGHYFGAGTRIPALNATNPGNLSIRATMVPAGTPLNLFNTAAINLNRNITVAAGTVIPAGVNLQPVGGVMEQMRPTQADGTQGRMWGAAPMLAAGSQSWSMRFTAGADLASADSRAVRAGGELALAGQSGDITLSDRHYLNPYVTAADGFSGNWLTRMRSVQQFSVLRTGTGSLDLLAGGSYRQYSLFGVYTAGTQTADIGTTTPDGHNAYAQPRMTLAGAENLANPWIGEKFDGYADSVREYRAWYPDHGGNMLLSVQGDLSGFMTGQNISYLRVGSANVTNWLWRQGAYGNAEGSQPNLGADIPTAWWINFGTYAPNAAHADSMTAFYGQNAPLLTGFMGIGTLGGGNLTVIAGGNAGMQSDFGMAPGDTSSNRTRGTVSSEGINLAVASTGRVTRVDRVAGFVTGGEVELTGGGEMQVRIGGSLNPMSPTVEDQSDMGGSFTNLRGDIDISAREIGRGHRYSFYSTQTEPRVLSGINIIRNSRLGGITLVPGDSRVRINTRGVLNIAGVGDPTSIQELDATGVSYLEVRPARTTTTYYWLENNSWWEPAGSPVPEDYLLSGACSTEGDCRMETVDHPASTTRFDGGLLRSSFTSWRDDTAIHLFSAGGDVSPVSMGTGNAALRDNRFWYPPTLTVTAPGGNIHWSAPICGNDCRNGIPALELQASPEGRVEFLAGGSIMGNSLLFQDGWGTFPSVMPIAMSGMSNSPELMPNLYRPAWRGVYARTSVGSPNAPALSGNTIAIGSNLAFQTDSNRGRLFTGLKDPALFYATGGDISDFAFGMIGWNQQEPYYMSSGSARIRAGRDIVHLGTIPSVGCGPTGPEICRSTYYIPGGPFHVAGLVVHNDPRDITYISAGRDIIYANMYVAGPGNMIVEAGRHVYQGDRGRFTSVGPLFDLNPETRMGGAAITVLTGVGAGGPSYDAFASLYLNPANRANPEYPLVHPENEGKVAHTYEAELIKWLADRYGYETGSPQEAIDYFNRLQPVERGIFTRQAYYDELKAGG
ncbi:hypothetical protein L6Q21_16475, partial [Sandaracinobacter sp. RS1-74]|uniref:hypothetical protein n=1 Tax=Sandaracinobacteroides sayramensis TaxID=2913411 RepID=UPI001EDAB28D